MTATAAMEPRECVGGCGRVWRPGYDPESWREVLKNWRQVAVDHVPVQSWACERCFQSIGPEKLQESPSPDFHHSRSRGLATGRNQHLRPAHSAEIRVQTRFLLYRLEDRFAALMEAFGTKMNWVLVFPLTGWVQWLLNRYCPLEFIPQDVHDRARRKRREDIPISLILKARQFGQPFLALQFFFTQRRDLLAQRLKVLEGLEYRPDEAEGRSEPGEPSHGGPQDRGRSPARPMVRVTPKDKERTP